MTLIIRYRETFILDDDIHTCQWARVFARFKGGEFVTKYKPLTRSGALEIISKEGLVLAEKDKTMEIYDTPHRDFQNTFGGRIVVTEL